MTQRFAVKVVCFSEIQWKYTRTRKQQILSRLPHDWEVLFLSSVVKGKPNNFLPQREGRIIHVCVPVFKNFPQKTVRALFSFPPMRFIWNIILYVWLHVIFLLTGFLGRDRICYVSNIYYAHILRFLPRTLMFYDCNDDHLAFPNTPTWAEGYYRRLALSADFAIAVSPGLVDKLRALGVPEVHLVGNGVDYELFNRIAGSGIPDEMERLKRPIIGYSGVVAPWFDFDVFDHVAESFPDASIVLLGPVYDIRREELQRVMEARGNIYHLGTKPYEELARYIAAMDVCIVPLQMNELMRLADPNKLYEHAATGRPIVTLKHSEGLESLRDIIYLAETKEEFVEQIRYALNAGVDEVKLKEFARRSSWPARVREVTRLILEDLRKKGYHFS